MAAEDQKLAELKEQLSQETVKEPTNTPRADAGGPESANEQQVPRKKTPMEMIKSLFKRPKKGEPAQGRESSSPIKMKSYSGRVKIIIGGAIFVVLILALSLVVPQVGRGVNQTIGLIPGVNGDPEPTVTPSPTPVPRPPENLRPSAYANDPIVLSIQDELRKIDENIGSTELREGQLRIPILDWDISF